MPGTSVLELGTPIVDGIVDVLRVGAGATYHEERLVWNLGQLAWVGQERYSMRQIDINGMVRQGADNSWAYPFQTDGLGGIDTAFGFQIWLVRQLGLLQNAGLQLQEKLSAYIKPTGDKVAQLALNWFALDQGDSFLSPVPTNIGLILNGVPQDNRFFYCSTGWQNSPANPIDPGKSGYPELYGKGTAFSFRRLTAQYRLVGGLAGPLGGAGETSQLPKTNKLFTWLIADNIPIADGASIAEWPDYSSFTRTLKQSDASKRPVLVRNALNGHAVARFDGINDFLQTSVGDTGSQPFTIFIVLKQYTAGSTQQVWISGGVGTSPLIYRFDAANQIDTWGGSGGDLTYNRASNWPSPYMVISMTFNGASSALWENGNLAKAADQEGGGWAGLTLGARNDGALPASIDVAEVIGYYQAMTDPDRLAVVNYLMSKYAIV